jgi:hypothetical protein
VPSRVPAITLPLVNPLPLLQYAIKIADEALYVSGAEPETVSGEVSGSNALSTSSGLQTRVSLFSLTGIHGGLESR